MENTVVLKRELSSVEKVFIEGRSEHHKSPLQILFKETDEALGKAANPIYRLWRLGRSNATQR